MSELETWDRLYGVSVARKILRTAFDLELVVVGEEGPVAHVRGGVMSSSSEACRAALFSREGFRRCDAEYRAVAQEAGPCTRRCHLGLEIIAETALNAEGSPLAHVIASGLAPEGFDADATARALGELDPHLTDPASLLRDVRPLAERATAVRAILRAAADEIEEVHREQERRLHRRDEAPGLWGMIGASARMKSVFELLPRLAASDSTVLILGESGTGKELVARALHDQSARSGEAWVAQNCAALPDALLESTLFGHVRGAFSGATQAREGLFGAAASGTLFLDEVGDMSPALQVKLLRVLQDGSYLPVGGTTPKRSDVRVIAATHRDLDGMVERGEFRQDLFFRLHVLPVTLPPLRDRTGDVRFLVEHFLRDVEAPQSITETGWRCLERYLWPGNVRELRAEITRWEVSATGARAIGPEHLSSAVREAGGYAGADAGDAATKAAAGEGTLARAVDELERAVIERGLERTRGNRSQLARELGISRTTLGERIKRYDLE